MELTTLEKKVQKQNEKMLKLMEQIDLVLECIEELKEQKEELDKRIRAQEQEVEELKPKVCQCARVEEVGLPEEVKKGHRMCLKHSDPLFFRRPLSWSTLNLALIWRT